MKIAAILNNATRFPVEVDPSTPKAGYGGSGRFWLGFAHGLDCFRGEIDITSIEDVEPKFIPDIPEHSLHIIAPQGSSSPSPLLTVHPVKKGLKDVILYRSEALTKARSIHPDAIIWQHPPLVPPDAKKGFCRVVGSKYHKYIVPGITHITNSNFGNTVYNSSYPVIHQTCNPAEVEFCDTKEDYFIWVSNLTRGFKEKGLKDACEIAMRAQVRLVVVGPCGKDRKCESILQNIITQSNGYVSYAGPVWGIEKRELLSKARAVLYPISLECAEMGSTLVVEAAFCGTPMITRGVGCMPEYVKHGVTGLLCDTRESFVAAAIRDVDSIAPENCKAWADENFDQTKIVRQYLEVMGNG